MNKILFVSHKKTQCGVYEFGKNIADALQQSKRYRFIRVECSSLIELQAAIAENAPIGIIYNFHQFVMPWMTTQTGPNLFRNNIGSIRIPQIGIIHDVTESAADTATAYRKSSLPCVSGLINSLFDFYIGPDPTLLSLNPIIYKTGRLVPSYQNDFPIPSKPVIGSFGFGTYNKRFEKIVHLVQQEFDEAIIRFNIPAADFGDTDGIGARSTVAKCRVLIVKPGIQLIVTHDYLDHKAMLDFLAQNTINVFYYEDSSGRGLASTIDFAMAVQRPIAISDSPAFRHLFDVEPSIRLTNNSLKSIIQNGFAPLQKHYNEWRPENLLLEYEKMLDSIFLYQPIQIPAGFSLNRILDNKARELYKPSIDKLQKLVPETMSRRIAEANVQQAFVFDTVHRYLPQYQNPKILCVGSNEDTASESLIKMGYAVEEIDSALNCSLREFFIKPTTIKSSYDIIFSTSVIEHDPYDESFIKCIAGLLAPGGVAIMTCDYKEGWKSGDPKPEIARLYTKQDLKDRLLPLMDNCDLVDEPQWDCPNPDFNYQGKYQYTFATFVVKKNQINVRGGDR